jgi:hypothetical protein
MAVILLGIGRGANPVSKGPWRASPPSKSVDARDKLIASLNGSKAYGQHVLAKPVP